MPGSTTTGPTFLGIGAQKAGTSWLHSQLDKHPQIWMPPLKKEIHYFDRSTSYLSPNDLATSSFKDRLFGNEQWERERTMDCLATIVRQLLKLKFQNARWWAKWTFGYYDEDWYRSLFSQAKADQQRGEVTPAYSILTREDVARIAALNPEMKLIFMLRNPIERAWSSIRFAIDRKNADFDITSSSAIVKRLQEPLMMLRGDYERTLALYSELFDPSQILIGYYDAISQDPHGLLSGVTEFLEISPLHSTLIDNQTRVNSSPPRPIPADVKDYLWETYSPMIERLASSVGGYAKHWNGDQDCPAEATLTLDQSVICA
ncbi:MAG: sulfotransferase [Cyanobacteria bacterium P01_E01_bin.45]